MIKKEQTTKKIDKTEEARAVDAKKRSFMKKFGKYAAVGAGATVLMKPGAALAGSDSAP